MQRFPSSISQKSLPSKKHLSTPSLWRPLLKRGPVAAYTALLFFLILITAAFISSQWLKFNTSKLSAAKPWFVNSTMVVSENHSTNAEGKPKQRIEFPLNCTTGNRTQTCSSTIYPRTFETNEDQGQSLKTVCPGYFRWIHEDLRPWKGSGITMDMVEKAKKTAHFRLVIIKGKAYVEKYKKSIQTRDVFTMWGILQLLRRAEINIKPWEHLLKEIKIGNERIKWNDREPYAYWKGNPFVAETRQDLLKCNVTATQDWNARLFVQDWIQESQQGFNQSNLASQCTHRYKIYIEGWAWSVSEKYILACDSVTLLVKPRFHDFFLRSLQPMQHYWPMRDVDKCKSINYAVDWGNNHKQKAQAIGRAASDFIQEELKMNYVYDYMFHLLNEYAKLLKFQPKVPEGAVELCAESLACSRSGSEKEFMVESLVKSPSTKTPCSLPPPFEPTSLRDFYRRKLTLIRRVEKFEDSYWKNLTEQQHANIYTK